MKLTLRDFLWVTLLVASVTMWLLEWRRGRELAGGHLRAILASMGREADDREVERRLTLARFRDYSDAELDLHLGELLCCGDGQRLHTELDSCLIEMARRKMVVELDGHYRAMFAQAK